MKTWKEKLYFLLDINLNAINNIMVESKFKLLKKRDRKKKIVSFYFYDSNYYQKATSLKSIR